MNCNFERAAITAIIGIFISWRYTLAAKTGWQTEGLPCHTGATGSRQLPVGARGRKNFAYVIVRYCQYIKPQIDCKNDLQSTDGLCAADHGSIPLDSELRR